jgi:putative transposase
VRPVACGAKYPKAVAKMTDDLDQLRAFYDFLTGHWIHARTTNPIESTCATVAVRCQVLRVASSRVRLARAWVSHRRCPTGV